MPVESAGDGASSLFAPGGKRPSPPRPAAARSVLPTEPERRILRRLSMVSSTRKKDADASPGGKGTVMKTLTLSAIALSAVLGFANGAQAQQAKRLFFEGDIVRHALADQAGPFCVLNNQFKRKEAVAWRIRVLEATAGIADDKVVKSMMVELGNGQKLPAHYGPHGMPPTDHFWSLFWTIPGDFPTGSLGYKVVATMMDGAAHGDLGRARDKAVMR